MFCLVPDIFCRLNINQILSRFEWILDATKEVEVENVLDFAFYPKNSEVNWSFLRTVSKALDNVQRAMQQKMKFYTTLYPHFDAVFRIMITSPLHEGHCHVAFISYASTFLSSSSSVHNDRSKAQSSSLLDKSLVCFRL